MAEQVVPWAPGRRALVFFEGDGHWREARGGTILPNGEAMQHWLWEADAAMLLDDGRSMASGGDNVWDAVLATARTALLPDQCPVCYEVGGHADGCMAVDNLARGVKPWLAPYVQPGPPPPEWGDRVEVYVVFHHGLEQVFHTDGWHTEAGEPPEPTALGWICIGPNGPTLAPWGLA